MGTEALWIPAVIAAVGAGAQYYNTERTEEKQDKQLAESIRGQTAKQREADARVNEEVAKLEQSTAAEERANRLQTYLDTVTRNRRDVQGNLTPLIGSGEFQGDAARTAEALDAYGGREAGLASRIDAPLLQRQGEGFGYGHLATDLSRIGRDVAGQRFIDQINLGRIKRNPWIDAGASAASGAASGMAQSAFNQNMTPIGPVTRQPIPIPVN